MALKDRLRQLIKEKGWSQAELARRAGVREHQINSWTTRNTEQPRRSSGINRVAAVLGVSVPYLLYGTEVETQRDKIFLAEHELPLVPLDTLSYLEPGQKALQLWDGRAKVTLPIGIFHHGPGLGRNAFGTVIADNSLSPQIDENDIVICDPDETPETGELCVAVVGDHAVVRVYDRHETEAGLRPLNGDFPENRLEEGDFVLAKCVYRLSVLGRF